MSVKTTSALHYVQSKNKAYQGSVSRLEHEFPLEVVTLLNVFSRIEARRQASLREKQRKVM